MWFQSELTTISTWFQGDCKAMSELPYCDVHTDFKAIPKRVHNDLKFQSEFDLMSQRFKVVLRQCQIDYKAISELSNSMWCQGGFKASTKWLQREFISISKWYHRDFKQIPQRSQIDFKASAKRCQSYFHVMLKRFHGDLKVISKRYQCESVMSSKWFHN